MALEIHGMDYVALKVAEEFYGRLGFDVPMTKCGGVNISHSQARVYGQMISTEVKFVGVALFHFTIGQVEGDYEAFGQLEVKVLGEVAPPGFTSKEAKFAVRKCHETRRYYLTGIEGFDLVKHLDASLQSTYQQ